MYNLRSGGRCRPYGVQMAATCNTALRSLRGGCTSFYDARFSWRCGPMLYDAFRRGCFLTSCWCRPSTPPTARSRETQGGCSRGSKFGVFALALFTIKVLPLAAAHSTTISFVPIAPAIVVFVIAIFVSCKVFAFACAFAALLFIFQVFGVFALALFTVTVLPLAATHSATISSVPITPAIVISVIAIFITIKTCIFTYA